MHDNGPVYYYRKSLKCGRLLFVIEQRPKNQPWGRFGGGWNWDIGVAAGGATIIIRLLVLTIKLCWLWPEVKSETSL